MLRFVKHVSSDFDHFCSHYTSVPFKRKKVRICEIMSGGFAVKIQQCVKKSGGFWYLFHFVKIFAIFLAKS